MRERSERLWLAKLPLIILVACVGVAGTACSNSQVSLKTWESNGFRLGVGEAEARTALQKVCLSELKQSAPRGSPPTTTMGCARSSVVIADKPMLVMLSLYEGKVLWVEFDASDVAPEWAKTVQDALTQKYGKGISAEMPGPDGPTFQAFFKPDSTLLIDFEYKPRKDNVSIMYVDVVARDRANAARQGASAEKASETAKNL